MTLEVVLKLDRPVFSSLPAGRLPNLSASVSSPGKQAAIPPLRVSVRSWKRCMLRLTQATLDNLGKKPAFPLSQFCGSETLAASSKELCAMMTVEHLLCVWCNEGLNFSLYSILAALHLNSHVGLAATALGNAVRATHGHDGSPPGGWAGHPLFRVDTQGRRYALLLRSHFFPQQKPANAVGAGVSAQHVKSRARRNGCN